MSHQWKRTDKKVKKLANRAVKSNIKAYDFGFLTQPELFKHVYFIHKKPVICPSIGSSTLHISYLRGLIPTGSLTLNTS
jgi:hypothetical protein